MAEIRNTHLPLAQKRIEATKAGQEAKALNEELAMLDAAAKSYVLAQYQPGTGFESDHWLATHVQGHTRRWDEEKLSEILTPEQFLEVIDFKVNRQKVDELVRSGAVSKEAIDAAFEEKPNQPYVLITPRSDANAGAVEADSLAEALS